MEKQKGKAGKGKGPKRDISPLFRKLGKYKDVSIRMPEYAFDNDLVGGIKKGWVYGALLSFREYSRRHGRVNSFATIGTGVGADAIGASMLLEPEQIIITDLHPKIPRLARENLLGNLSSASDVVSLEGDLCKPMLERGLEADLVYANLPNIPSDDAILEERRNVSFFRKREACPEIFEKYLLAHQHSFLEEAKGVLKKGGGVVLAVGGRLPYNVLQHLFSKTGYSVEELASVFKYQTEAKEVLSSYAKAERGGVEFDFYRYAGAQELWEEFEASGLSGAEIKENLGEFRVSASEAWRMYRSGECTEFGIVAHYLCGKRKPEVEAASSVRDAVGNTPLIRVDCPEFVCPVYGKMEMLNPGGSMKDRVAEYMIREAERKGLLKPGGTIIEASSGNQGASLAMIGAASGYNVIITASTKISEEKRKTLGAFGAEVRIFEPTANLEDPESYYMQAKKLAEEIPGAYWPDQYHNPLNPKAHYLTTGPEIWKQTGGRITHFFAAAGSTGTVCGVGKYLKEKSREVKVIAVDAADSSFSSREPKPYKAEGLGIDYIPAFLDRSVIDEVMVATDGESFSNTRRIARENGMLLGGSSGAVLHALLEYSPKFKKEDLAVALFADSGRSYLSKIF